MNLHKQIPLADRTRLTAYWATRGVALHARSDGTLAGARGSVSGALWSAHVARMPTTVEVRPAPGGLECVVTVDTRLRALSPHSRRYLELELDELERFVTTGELLPEAWEAHRRTAAQASLEILRMGQRHLLRRKGPLVIGGDLKLKAWIMGGLALAMPALALLIGGSIAGWLRPPRSASSREVAGVLLGPGLAVAYFAIFLALALWMLGLRRRSARCVSLEKAAAAAGVDPESMRRTAAECGVEPRYILDGEPVYDPDELTGAMRLLRPAKARAGECLLRPAGSASSAPGELLLPAPARPTGSARSTEAAEIHQGRLP